MRYTQAKATSISVFCGMWRGICLYGTGSSVDSCQFSVFACHSERSERGPRPAPGSPANLFAGVELAGWGRKNPRILPCGHRCPPLLFLTTDNRELTTLLPQASKLE